MKQTETIRIMVLDDDQNLLEAFYNLMRSFKLDYEPEFFQDGNLALQAIDNDPDRYHVVLTDMKMPGMDGVEFIRRVREKYPDLPIVVMTAYFSDEASDKVKSLGSVLFIEKPFRLEKLLKHSIPKLLTTS